AAIVGEDPRRIDSDGAGAMRDGFLERGLDALVADREHHVFDALWQCGERRKAGYAEHRFAAGIGGKQRAGKSALQQVFDEIAAYGARALTRPDHGDRGRAQQWVESMRHVAFTESEVAGRRG